jgi:hypothetical protein
MKSGLPKKIADEIEKFEAEKLQRGHFRPNSSRKMSASTSNSETGSRRLQIPPGLAVLDLVPGLGSDKPPLVLRTLERLHTIVTSHWPHWQREVLEAKVVPALSELLQSNDETILKTVVCCMSIDLAWKCESWIMDHGL